MVYSIVDTTQAVLHGLVPAFHRRNKDGSLMIVNENELLDIDSDREKAASILRGEVLTLDELFNKIKAW